MTHPNLNIWAAGHEGVLRNLAEMGLERPDLRLERATKVLQGMLQGSENEVQLPNGSSVW